DRQEIKQPDVILVHPGVLQLEVEQRPTRQLIPNASPDSMGLDAPPREKGVGQAIIPLDGKLVTMARPLIHERVVVSPFIEVGVREILEAQSLRNHRSEE